MFFNFIIFFTARFYTRAGNEFVSPEELLVLGDRPLFTGFFRFYIMGILENLGNTQQTNDIVLGFSDSRLTILVIVPTIFILSYFVLYFSARGGFLNKNIMIFRGNWLLYVLILAIPLVILKFFDASDFLYDQYLQTSFFNPPRNWSLVILVFLGLAKNLANISQLPMIILEQREDLYPDIGENLIDPQNEYSAKEILAFNLLGMKVTVVSLVEYMIFVDLTQNLPGVGRVMILALRNLDLIAFLAAIFQLLVIIFLLRFLIDIVLHLIDQTEHDILYQSFKPAQNTFITNSVFIVSRGIILYFILSIIFSGIMLIFFAINPLEPKIFFLFNPNEANVQSRNLDILTQGHIFGTDSLGRDIFSRLVFGALPLFIPILVAVFVRIGSIKLLNKIFSIEKMILKFTIIDILEGLPKFGVTLTVYMFLLIAGRDSIAIALTVWLSIFLWGRIAKLNLYSQNIDLPFSRSRNRSLIGETILAIIIELTLLGFYVHWIGDINWGETINSVNTGGSQGFARILIAYLYPILIILALYFYSDMNRRGKNRKLVSN